MFALGIRYLNGWSMAASDGAQKEQAEWPPHPDRVFMALAAGWFETGEDAEEGDALRWLESLPPPDIAALDASFRSPVVSYVPVNDDGHKKISNPKTELAKLRKQGLAYLPEHRSRRARRFPVAIPYDPTVYLFWSAALGRHCKSLKRLATKVTNVGHSASLVQVWVDLSSDAQPAWVPTEGIADRRFRIPSTGRLEQLARPHREAWKKYRSNLEQIERVEADLKGMVPPPRVAWRRTFPDVVLLAKELETKRHSDYDAAKSGNDSAAARLVDTLVDDVGVAAVRKLLGGGQKPALLCAHAYEREGVNAIPAALSEWLSARLDVPYIPDVVQSNVVAHTGADGYGRLARQARFDGDIERGRQYVMVDDFIGQGGTLANLRGWVEKQGGTVIGAIALTGKHYSAKLSPTKEQLDELRKKHGRDFEKWWRKHFGHAFNCLTQSEARYLARSPDVDTIRNRLAAAKRQGDCANNSSDIRKQKQRIKKLKAYRPSTPLRPVPGKWQGYARAKAEEKPSDSAPRSVFDPRLVVLSIKGRRISLPTTAKLMEAVRGLLMRECPVQPPPAWFSGHLPDGRPTRDPHLAIAPLSFVGAQHADGRIMGVALILPRGLDPKEAGKGIGAILHDPDTGLPREHRLFDGQWFEIIAELETRERPPVNLKPSTWTSRSRTWASVTPVVLNRHFNGRDRWVRAAENIKEACGHIGLPRPREVLLHPVSLVEGVPHSREFPRLTRKCDRGRQSHAHAVIIFDEPVCGPVLVGAGRFRGYGLCRPMGRSD